MVLGILELCAIVGMSVFCAGAAVGVTVKILKRRSEERKRRLWKPRNSLQQYPSFVANRITGMITIVPHGSYIVKEEVLVCPQFLIALAPPLEYTADHPQSAVESQAFAKSRWFIGSSDDFDTDGNNNNVIHPNLDLNANELNNKESGKTTTTTTELNRTYNNNNDSSRGSGCGATMSSLK